MKNRYLLPLFAMATLAPAAVHAAETTDTASYTVETEVKLMSDQRNRGISDSLNRPSAQLGVQFAHESGLIALAQVSTINKMEYTNSDGAHLLLAAGWRTGDPEGWHFGLGLASERFPGARFDAPHAFDPDTGMPANVRTTSYTSSYAVGEIGWGALEARILNVISRNYRGASTGGVCGQMLALAADPTKALACYARGDQTSRGSWLVDLDYKIPLSGITDLKLHAGTQKIRHFKEANYSDYAIGLLHRRWGYEWSADYIVPKTRTQELFQVIDGDRLRSVDTKRLVVSVARKF